MKQYYIDAKQELTTDRTGQIINDFMLTDLPKLKQRYNYFIGKQAIVNKVASDDGKPCNKVVTNYVRSIVETYEGYAVGVPVSYANDNKGFDELIDIFNYNDVNSEDSNLFRDALIYGRSCEICYIDNEKKQRFRTLNPQTIIPIYSNALDDELLYVIRFWTEEEEIGQPKCYIEIYDKYEVTKYISDTSFLTFNIVSKMPHYHSQVPITIFSLNQEEEALAEQVFSLQDAYNSLLSDSIDDFDAFCDAYMIIKGMTADDDDIKAMKQHRVLLMDSDADASYLTKNVSTQEIENLLQTTEDKIREISNCPNFADESFGTSSGIAMKMKLLGMENKVSTIMNNFKKALQRRVELLADILRLYSGENLWRDIKIEFHRNVPVDLASVASEINAFRGLVSDETLLAQIPFIENVQEELERIANENESKVNLYEPLAIR